MQFLRPSIHLCHDGGLSSNCGMWKMLLASAYLIGTIYYMRKVLRIRTAIIFGVMALLFVPHIAFADDLKRLELEYEKAMANFKAVGETVSRTCARVEEVRLLTKTVNPEIKGACMARIKEVVRAGKATGLSRREMMPTISPLLFECQESAQGATLADLVAAQKQCLAVHDSYTLAHDSYSVASNAYMSEQQRVLNSIEGENETLRARIAAIRADTAAKLAEAERILQRLATQ